MGRTQGKKRGNAKKIGRDREKGQRYRQRGIRKKNKIRKLEKHVKDQPNDKEAYNKLRSVKSDVREYDAGESG